MSRFRFNRRLAARTTDRLVSAALITTLLTAVSIFSACVADSKSDPLEVQTTNGRVKGMNASRAGIRAYLGIPYAAAPTGDHRWKAPQPAAAWEGTLDATQFGNRCIQTNPFPDMLFQSAAESEDCLNLSVWTGAAPDERRPVMVWIHGGGYFSGAGDEKRHDGSVLADKGVVVVTINYRLGVMGFLSHPDLTAESSTGASGNYGLLDQIAALHWVQDNIAAFGGDPTNVTIFGESAGSFSVSALMASPLARGLFHKAICESGAHMTGGTLALRSLADAESAGAAFAAQVGAPSITELRETSPTDVIAAVKTTRAGFGPIVDGNVLPRPVWKIFDNGDQANVPLIAGWNSAEIKMPPVSPEEFRMHLREVFPDDFDAASTVFPSGTDREAWLSEIALRSDAQFIGFGTWKLVEVHSRNTSQPVFRFLFDQPLPSKSGPAADDDPGASHASEIEYVFGTLDSKDLAWGDVDRSVSDRMSTWWTNFAKSGDPNRPVETGTPVWPAYENPGSLSVLRIKGAPVVESDPNRERFEFLDMIEMRRRSASNE